MIDISLWIGFGLLVMLIIWCAIAALMGGNGYPDAKDDAEQIATITRPAPVDEVAVQRARKEGL